MGKLSKIVLGTAQLGQEYGIANKSGKPKRETAFKILQVAIENGINMLDTAASYGESEQIIGEFIKSEKATINIITKIPPTGKLLANKTDFKKYLKESFFNSLEKLHQKKIYGLLLHSFGDFARYRDESLQFFKEIKKGSLAEKTGLSVYSPNEIEETLEDDEIDIYQAPLNVWDNRLIKTGIMKKICSKNKTLFARSIFLQGLFFLPHKQIIERCPEASKYHEKLSFISAKYRVPIDQLAFCFVRDNLNNGHLVIGAESPEQIINNIALLKKAALPSEIINEIERNFSDVPETIINPTLWRKKIKI
jgi:aryl-alcohol dehydrogenase-like predicted oxidoreductase